MKSRPVLVAIFFLYFFAPAQCIFGIGQQILENNLPEDAKLNFTGLAVKNGHTVEEFEVETEDGYLLTMFHIIGTNKTLPFLLLHGIGDSCDTFIIRQNISLAITLADQGYDVWALNSRGNKYSRKHKTLNPNTDKKYWNFSFHEIGYYDLAAGIDFILNATGQKQVRTVGHSQGTSAHFVLASMRPEYNAKIKVFLALAPVAFMNNVKPPLSLIIDVSPVLNTLFITLGKEELFNNYSISVTTMKLVCTQLGTISYDICLEGLTFLLVGADPAGVEEEFLPYILAHFPSGTSRKSLMHFAKNSLHKRFAQYGNDLIELNSPPSYDLSKITMDVALFCGKNDKLSELADVALLKEKLPNIVEYREMEPDAWNHIDHVYSLQMPIYLTPHILDLMRKY